jgi:hypothetical protein
MPFQPDVIDVATLKRLAKHLKQALQRELAVTAPLTRVQAVLAQTLGYPDWRQAMAARAPTEAMVAPAETEAAPPPTSPPGYWPGELKNQLWLLGLLAHPVYRDPAQWPALSRAHLFLDWPQIAQALNELHRLVERVGHADSMEMLGDAMKGTFPLAGALLMQVRQGANEEEAEGLVMATWRAAWLQVAQGGNPHEDLVQGRPRDADGPLFALGGAAPANPHEYLWRHEGEVLIRALARIPAHVFRTPEQPTRMIEAPVLRAWQDQISELFKPVLHAVTMPNPERDRRNATREAEMLTYVRALARSPTQDSWVTAVIQDTWREAPQIALALALYLSDPNPSEELLIQTVQRLSTEPPCLTLVSDGNVNLAVGDVLAMAEATPRRPASFFSTLTAESQQMVLEGLKESVRFPVSDPPEVSFTYGLLHQIEGFQELHLLEAAVYLQVLLWQFQLHGVESCRATLQEDLRQVQPRLAMTFRTACLNAKLDHPDAPIWWLRAGILQVLETISDGPVTVQPGPKLCEGGAQSARLLT